MKFDVLAMVAQDILRSGMTISHINLLIYLLQSANIYMYTVSSVQSRVWHGYNINYCLRQYFST